MLQCYAIKDEKTGGFFAPFFSQHVAHALRSVTIAAQDSQSQLHRFAEDYSVWRMFSWDESSGFAVDVDEGPQHIVNVVSLLNMNKESSNVKA